MAEQVGTRRGTAPPTGTRWIAALDRPGRFLDGAAAHPTTTTGTQTFTGDRHRAPGHVGSCTTPPAPPATHGDDRRHLDAVWAESTDADSATPTWTVQTVDSGVHYRTGLLDRRLHRRQPLLGRLHLSRVRRRPGAGPHLGEGPHPAGSGTVEQRFATRWPRARRRRAEAPWSGALVIAGAGVAAVVGLARRRQLRRPSGLSGPAAGSRALDHTAGGSGGWNPRRRCRRIARATTAAAPPARAKPPAISTRAHSSPPPRSDYRLCCLVT